jgi:biotin carboxyl carrier protein
VIFEVITGGKTRRVELVRAESGWKCKLDGKDFPADVSFPQPGVLSILVNGKSYEVKQQAAQGETGIVIGQELFNVVVSDPRSLAARRRASDDVHGVRKITAPMPGKVVRILAPVGTAVEAGQAVLVIEAMKMQNELKSPKKGTVKKLNVSEGAAVEAGQALAEVE